MKKIVSENRLNLLWAGFLLFVTSSLYAVVQEKDLLLKKRHLPLPKGIFIFLRPLDKDELLEVT